MKFTLALAIVLAAVAAVCDSSVIKASTRANLIVGSIRPGDRNLYTGYVRRNAVANSIQSEQLIWRGNGTNWISAVQATEVGGTQLARAWIYSGGVGWTNVTVSFQSARSRGYYYQLSIWGR